MNHIPTPVGVSKERAARATMPELVHAMFRAMSAQLSGLTPTYHTILEVLVGPGDDIEQARAWLASPHAEVAIGVYLRAFALTMPVLTLRADPIQVALVANYHDYAGRERRCTVWPFIPET